MVPVEIKKAANRNFAQRLGPIGSAISFIISFTTTNWVLVMSTISAIGIGLSTWGAQLASDPRVQVAVVAFLSILWSAVGVAVLIDRNRPKLIRPAQDFSYGLTFEGISVIYVHQRAEGLQFIIMFRNFSSGPLRVQTEKFSVFIEDRAKLMPNPTSATTFLPRGGGRTITLEPFKLQSIKEFFGKSTKGKAEFSVLYGH